MPICTHICQMNLWSGNIREQILTIDIPDLWQVYIITYIYLFIYIPKWSSIAVSTTGCDAQVLLSLAVQFRGAAPCAATAAGCSGRSEGAISGVWPTKMKRFHRILSDFAYQVGLLYPMWLISLIWFCPMKSHSMPIRYIVGVSFIVRDIATQFMFILDPYFCRLNQNKGHQFFGLSHYLIVGWKWGIPLILRENDQANKNESCYFQWENIANYLIDQREFGVPNLETTASRHYICTTVPTAGCKDD